MGTNRFNREITGKFGSEGDAFEVFIAELGSAFPMAYLGIVGEGQHENYVASWLKAFEERQRLYFQRRQRGVKSASLFDG